MSRTKKPAGKRRSFRGDHRDMLAAIERTGARVEPTGGQHLKVYCPQGPVIIAQSPSDHRSVRNAVTRLRRHGLDLAGVT